MATIILAAFFVTLLAAGCAGDSPRSDIVYDADVIVVGSGLAGHGAVYGALEQGAKVLLLEKSDILGGASFSATGTYAAVGTAVQKAMGIVDSRELFIKDINRIGHGKADQAILAKFVDTSTGVWVDRTGARFVNEDETDEDIRETAIQTVPDGKMIVVFDQGIIEKNGGKTPIRDFDKRMADGFAIKKADTLEDLAVAFGVDPAGLKATVESVNATVAANKTDGFGKSPGMAFGKGPWYGVLFYATIFMTQGGVKVDTKLRAVDAEDKPVKGLYAAGEIMGTTQWGGYGYSGGTGNAPAIVFGMDAGREAAVFALGK